MKLRLFVAVDGSDASARAVEHVAHVARSGCDVVVTLFHACPEPPARLETGGAEDPRRERAIEDEQRARRQDWELGARDDVEKDVFAPARRVLADAGLSEHAIETRSRFEAHLEPASLIVEEAAGADAIVIGRDRGSHVLGSVSSKVLERVHGCAVWIVE